jgi:signal transduction histidine kinase
LTAREIANYLQKEVKEALYRIAQEAMHNTVKYARASHIQVDLTQSETDVILRTEDDGIGFKSSDSFPGHLGLQSMRGRTGRLGGDVDIDSAPGNGTRVRAIIPKRGKARR